MGQITAVYLIAYAIIVSVMSICIHENCDATTVEERPKKHTGALLLSQLYCSAHLEEATEGADEDALQGDVFLADDE